MLQTSALADAIKNAFTSLQNNENNGLDATGTLANNIASAIEAFVKSGEVEVTAMPAQIQVEGTPAKQANIAPISIKGKVS